MDDCDDMDNIDLDCMWSRLDDLILSIDLFDADDVENRDDENIDDYEELDEQNLDIMNNSNNKVDQPCREQVIGGEIEMGISDDELQEQIVDIKEAKS